MDSESHAIGIMKTTVDIPDRELRDAMRHAGAKTKREAIVTAIVDFNRRRRMAALTKHSGTSETMMSHEEMKARDSRRARKLQQARI